MQLQGCLNGARTTAEHPRCPITPEDLAREAAAVATAGVAALHVHPRDDDGRETLAGSPLGDALVAIRAAVSVPLGVSTGAWILPDPLDRLREIERWEALPDFASVNFHEQGAVEVASLLIDRGVGVEAGLWHEQGAAVLLESSLADQCVRLLLEPMEPSVEGALRTVAAIDRLLDEVAPGVPRLLHGADRTTWPMLEEAVRRGDHARIGFEDTLERPDGRRAASNEELARIAIGLTASAR